MASSSFFLDYWDFSVLLCLVICNNSNYDVSPIDCGYWIKIEAISHAAETILFQNKWFPPSNFLNSDCSKTKVSTYPNPNKPQPVPRAKPALHSWLCKHCSTSKLKKLNSFFLYSAAKTFVFFRTNIMDRRRKKTNDFLIQTFWILIAVKQRSQELKPTKIKTWVDENNLRQLMNG